MKESNIINYLNELNDIEEKYCYLQAELDAKRQLDIFLLEQRYKNIILGWRSQKDIIIKYLIEKEAETKKKEIEKEKEKETAKTKMEKEKIEKEILSIKNELNQILSLKKIFEMKNSKKENMMVKLWNYGNNLEKNNGGNLP